MPVPEPPPVKPPGGSGGGGSSGGDGGGGSSSSGGGSSSSSGGSSGGSSSGGSTDVYVSDTFKDDAVKRQKEQAFAQVYQTLWGEPATEQYLMKAVNEGLNTWEFTARERGKPEWAHTKAYKDQARSFADLFAQLGIG